MKAKELKVSPEKKNIVEVDVSKGSQIVMICDGKAKLLPLPEHGEIKITAHQGKIKRYRLEEGEEF